MAYVLIVDDDQDFADSVSRVLCRAGHEVQIELDPQDGLNSMLARRPDLMILDVMFPEDASAGFTLAQTIQKEHAELKTVPLLMLTAVNAKFPLGFSADDIDNEWMPVGQFLEKPIALDTLRDTVAAMLGEASQSQDA